MGMPWRGIIHDMSKFLLSEFIPYARWFYSENGVKYMKSEPDDFAYWSNAGHGRIRERFDLAWLRHQKRNKHHWQYWVLVKDEGVLMPVEMPMALIKEMVADWRGAGRAQGHGNDVKEWYSKNKDKMILGDITRARVELMIDGVAVIA